MGEWILLAVGTLFFYACLEGIFHLFRLRRRGFLRAKEYRDPEGRFSFRYPAEWDLEDRRGRLVFTTHDHDGKLELLTHPKSEKDPPASDFLQAKLRISGLQLDDPGLHSLPIDGRAVAYVESRATQEDERLYLQEWVIDAKGFRIALSYRSSVLYGLVDGFSIDRMVRSLEIADTLS